MTQHTTGPWMLRRHGKNHFTVHFVTDGPGLIADIHRNEDARLIAAAPDLLDALELILNCEGAALHGARTSAASKGLDVTYHFNAVRAALARARGEA